MTVTLMTARVSSHSGKVLRPSAIARIIDQCPNPVQCGGSQVIRVPGDNIAGRITNRASNTFNPGIRFLPFTGARLYLGKCLSVVRVRWNELAGGPLPLVEKRCHVHDEIPDNRKIPQWLNPDMTILCHTINVGPARPAWHAVDRHGARSAHTDATGKTIRQRWIESPLHMRDHIEDRLARTFRHTIGHELAGILAAPNLDNKVASLSRLLRH